MPNENATEPGRKHAETRERLLLAVIFVLGVVAIWVGYIEAVEGWSEIVAEVVRELGVALVIAAALGFVVDQYLKAKLVGSIATEVSQQVALNTSNYVFGYFVTSDLKEELLDLMRPPVLRRNLKLRITLEPLLRDQDEFVRVTTKLDFMVQNLKDQVISFPHQLSMNNTFVNVEAPTIRRFACRAKSRNDYEYDYKSLSALRNASAEGVALTQSEDGTGLGVRRLVSLPPLSDEYVFWTESTEAMKVPYNDQFSFGNATAFVEVYVDCPEDLDLTVEFDKGRDVPVFMDPIERPRYWRYEGVCLAGQYISYKFRRRPGTTPLPVAATQP